MNLRFLGEQFCWHPILADPPRRSDGRADPTRPWYVRVLDSTGVCINKCSRCGFNDVAKRSQMHLSSFSFTIHEIILLKFDFLTNCFWYALCYCMQKSVLLGRNTQPMPSILVSCELISNNVLKDIFVCTIKCSGCRFNDVANRSQMHLPNFLFTILGIFIFPDMPCMKRVYRDKKRRSTGQQPGRKSAYRPGDKPVMNR